MDLNGRELASMQWVSYIIWLLLSAVLVWVSRAYWLITLGCSGFLTYHGLFRWIHLGFSYLLAGAHVCWISVSLWFITFSYSAKIINY